MNAQLPTKSLFVDFSSQNPGDQIFNNLATSGCCVIQNHGVDIKKLQKILPIWNAFFNSDKKFDYLRTDETDEGYIPINGESQRKGEIPDYKELYQAHYTKIFPSVLLDSQETCELFDSLVNFGKQIFSLLDEALPEDITLEMSCKFSDMIGNTKNHLFRVIHYPPIGKGIHIPRSASHTDICLLTILFGSAFGGAELMDHDGSWYVPNYTKNDLIIFTSDMMEYATNGKIKATTHRVEANPNHENLSRYAVITSIHPHRSAVLHNNTTAGVYLKNRLNAMGYNGNELNLAEC